MNDELALQEALHDLTLGQPAPPVDRFIGVRRRHVRRRLVLVTTAAATTAVAIVGALLAVGPLASNHAVPANHPAPAWVLPWPARYDGIDAEHPSAARATQAAAIAYYERFHGNTIHDPRTLYVGRPSGLDVRWVVVEASHQLVALASSDQGLSWVPFVSAAPPPATPAVGFAWDTIKDGHKAFVLGSPGMTTVDVGYLAPDQATAFGGSRQVHGGVGVVGLPRSTRPGELFVANINAGSVFPAIFPEGTAEPKALLTWQKALDMAPAGGRLLSFETGQGGGDVASLRVPSNGTVTVSIACVGPAPVRLTIVGPADEATSSQSSCHGTAEPVSGQETMLVHRGDRLHVTTDMSPFTYFAVGVYLVP